MKRTGFSTDAGGASQSHGRATMADVATAAEVSIGTVSHVLNGTVAVSDDRRKRVIAAIEKLGYRPNMLAQSLRRHRTSVVGVCVPHVANTFFLQLVESFERLSIADGWENIHVFARLDQDHLREKMDWLVKLNVNGIILLPSIDAKETLDSIFQSGVPTVVVDRPLDDDRFDQVVTDAAGAMQEVIRGIAARNHRTILFATASLEYLVTKRRIAGLRQALAEHPDLEVRIIEIEGSEEGLVRQLASEFVADHPPTAVIVGSGQIAARMLRAMRKLGNLIPYWPAVVSFDQPDWADLSSPQISVVRHPVEAIAAKAWQMLIDRMSGHHGPGRHFLLSGQVDLRAAPSLGAAQHDKSRKKRDPV